MAKHPAPVGAAVDADGFLATLVRVFASSSNQAGRPDGRVTAGHHALPRRTAAQAAAAVKWITRVCDADRLADSPDALAFCLALASYLSDLPQADMALMIDVLLAIYGNHTAKAKALESAAERFFAKGQQAPVWLRAFVQHGIDTDTDYTRRRQRGGNAWRLADRNLALVREAYDWRLEQPVHDWREQHQDLAEPAELVEWTVYDLTIGLNRIEADCSTWRAVPLKGCPVFYPSAELCRTYGMAIGNPQDELLHKIYPAAFRGLLTAHIARLALAEWERCFDEALETA